MKKRLLNLCLAIVMVWTVLPIPVAADSEPILILEILQRSGTVSYDDLPTWVSAPFNHLEAYLPVENRRGEGEYIERNTRGSYSNAAGKLTRYSITVQSCDYCYTSNISEIVHNEDFHVSASVGSAEILDGLIRPVSNYDGMRPTGFRNINLGDSYATVLQKLGFPSELEKYMWLEASFYKDHAPSGFVREKSTDPYNETVPYITLSWNQSFDTARLGGGKGITLRFGQDGNLIEMGYSNWELLEKLIGFTAPESSASKDEYVYDSADPGEGVSIPTELLDKITDSDSATDAIQQMANGMTREQKSTATGIDLATLYAETAVSKAASKTVNSNEIIISAASVAELGAIASEASSAAETALADGGLATARYLSNTVTLTTDETGEITIKIDPDILTTEVDKIRVETPTYALTLKAADLKEDLTEVLTITAEDVGSGFAPGKRNQKTSVKINLPKGKTTNPVTISLSSDSGATTYQAVVKTDGTATASKYNPVTTTMDGKINTSGTYTVQTNEKNFADIANKSAEMQKAILYLTSKGIINGTSATEFSPDGTINRQQIAALIMRALGKVDNTAKPTFTDVSSSSSLYHAIASSQKHKIINGYSDNTFRGANVINRSQIITVAGRVLTTEMNYKTPSNASTYLAKYSDTVPDYAKEMVALATRENLVVYRTDGTFSGAKNMTRGDAAIILYRLFQKIW